MKSPQEYTLIINKKNRNFKNLLDEIVNSYPLYKLNKNIDSYKEIYEKDMINLEKLKGNIFLLSSDLQNNSKSLTKFIKEKNNIIEKLNNDNEKLVEKLNTLENQDNAANGELQSKNINFYMQLLQNFLLLTSAILLSIKYINFLGKKL